MNLKIPEDIRSSVTCFFLLARYTVNEFGFFIIGWAWQECHESDSFREHDYPHTYVLPPRIILAAENCASDHAGNTIIILTSYTA